MVAGLQKETLGMQCPDCRGEMLKATTPFDIHRKGYHVFWEAVPAWVCQQCGNPVMEKSAVDAIQNSLTSLDMEASRMISSLGKAS
jgi:YgiT-type zinc finger domain-containing protein